MSARTKFGPWLLLCACTPTYTAPALGGDAGTGATDAAPLSDAALQHPLLGTALTIGAGYSHTCAVVTAGGGLKCWGANDRGQLGLGDVEARGDDSGEIAPGRPLVSLGGGATVLGVFSGVVSSHTCALLSGGVVKCWGNGENGRLGNGDALDRGTTPSSTGDALLPTNLGSGVSVAELACGASHTCARLVDGRVKCFGDNSLGQLGLGDKLARGGSLSSIGDALPFVDLGTGARALSIAAGANHTCVRLDTNRMKCWGSNANGELGLGDTMNRGDDAGEMGNALPTVELGTSRTVTAISLGFGFSCALLDDMRVKCWGLNDAGQLGLGTSARPGSTPGSMGENLPSVDLGVNQVAAGVAAGATFACSVLASGELKCWGSSTWGQLGIGTRTARGLNPSDMGDRLPTIDLGAGRRVRRIAAGALHACALLDNGGVKCWGFNATGQLGLGDTKDRGVVSTQMSDALPYVDLR